jgi:hypothetical protein
MDGENADFAGAKICDVGFAGLFFCLRLFLPRAPQHGAKKAP